MECEKSFLPAKAKGLHVRYQFSLTGPHGGDWWIEVDRRQSSSSAAAEIANPEVAFMASDNDWVALIQWRT